MNAGLRTVLVLALAGVAACASGDAEAEGTEDLTRTMLEQPAGDGVSTPLAVDPSMFDEGPRVSVAEVGFNRGDTTALVKVVEMSDYGCGYCRQFHEETFGPIREEFIATGMVEWKFVPYISGMFENSLVATEAAECTYAQSPGAFETLNARLWADQSTWKRSSDPETVVHGWVGQLGIDMGEFNSCLDDDARIPRIAAATTLAGQIGVRGTPTFVVIGWPPLQGALPLDMFRDVLTAAHTQLAEREGEMGDSGAPDTP